jgi:hypothetical protein
MRGLTHFRSNTASRKRRPWFAAKTADNMADQGQEERSTSAIYCNGNRGRLQVGLGRQRRQLVGLPAIRGRVLGACLCAAGKQRKLEKAAPRQAGSAESLPGENSVSRSRGRSLSRDGHGHSRSRGCSRGLKFRRGPCVRQQLRVQQRQQASRRPPQRREGGAP